MTNNFKVGNGGKGDDEESEKKGVGFEVGVKQGEGIAGKENKVSVESDEIFSGAGAFVVADKENLDKKGENKSGQFFG